MNVMVRLTMDICLQQTRLLSVLTCRGPISIGTLTIPLLNRWDQAVLFRSHILEHAYRVGSPSGIKMDQADGGSAAGLFISAILLPVTISAYTIMKPAAIHFL